jgi:hypothetical protein
MKNDILILFKENNDISMAFKRNINILENYSIVYAILKIVI